MSQPKRKPKGQGRGKGVRHSELHPGRMRAIQPPHPPKPKSSAMAAPVKRIAVIEQIEVGAWASHKDIHNNSADYCEMTALLTDGRIITREVRARYKRGQQQRIMEAIAGPPDRAAIEAADRDLRNVLCRRATALQTARGELERAYGNGVPACPTS